MEADSDLKRKDGRACEDNHHVDEVKEEIKELEDACKGLDLTDRNVIKDNVKEGDEVSNVREEPELLSDSSPVQVSQRAKPTQTELSLVRHFSKKEKRQEMDLLPVVDLTENAFFSVTLTAYPEMNM